MSQERTLAFLQNFYTDVTLYVPKQADESTTEPSAPVMEPVGQTLVRPLSTLTAPGAPLTAPGAPPVAAGAPLTPPLSPPVAAGMPPRPPQAPILRSLTARPDLAPAPAPAVPPVMLTTFSTLGSNAQGVVLLFRLPPEQFKKLPRNVFLNKMLQALGMVMADVVLVNVESHLPVALSNLRREIDAGRILAFGKNLLDIAVRNTQIYEPVQFVALNLSYLAAAEVELIEYDNSLKKRLWQGLQRMFL